MSSYDGSIRINTKLNTANFDLGVKRLYENAKQSFSKIGRLVAGALSVAALVKFGKEAIQLSSDLAEVQNVVDTAFGDMAYKMEQFADTAVDTYGMSKLTAKGMGSLFASMGRGMGQSLDAATDGAVELTGRLGDVASFYNLTMERAKTLGKAIYTGETEPLKDIGVVMTEANLSTYALSKGYSKLYKEMSATEKLEVRQKFFLDQTALAAGDFVKTQDSWANQTKLLSERWREFMTSVGSTLTTVLTPALALLNNIVAALTNVAQAIEQVTNKLFGKTTKAAKSSAAASKNAADAMVDYGESIAEADKKASGSLASFDDLNVLQKKETSSSASAGKSNGITDISSTVKDAEAAEEELTGLAKRIKDAIDTDDWGDIGSSISEKINGALPDDNFWEKFQKKLNKGAKGLASGLNGFIKELNWSKIGSTIAKALNSALKAVNTFLKEFDFEEAGKAIMEAVGGFFEDLDWSSISEFISTALADLLDFIAGLIEGADWKSLPKNVFKAIIEFVKGYDFAKLAESIGKVIGAAMKAAIDYVTGLASLVKDIYKKIKEYFEKYINKAKESGGTVLEGILAGIVNGLLTIGKWLYNNLVKPFFDGLCKAFGIEDGVSGVTKKVGSAIVKGVKAALNLWESCKEKITDFKDKIVEKFDSIKEKTGSKIEAARENIKTHLSNLWADNKEKVGDFKDKLVEKFEAVRDNVVSPVRKMRDSVKSAFRSMWTGVKDIINSMLEGIEKFANGMINGVNAVIDGLNKLSFDVKNPFTGEEYKMGVSIKHIKEVEIPRLATGGITTGSTLARIGEAGREAVLPLENNLQYLDKFADRIARKIPKANNGPVYLQIDGATFARLLNPYSKAEQARIGLSFT